MVRSDSKEQEITPQHKLLLGQAVTIASLPYIIWAHSLKNPEKGVHQPTMVDGRLEDYGYLEEKQLTNKISAIINKTHSPTVRYLIDECGHGQEEQAVFPDLKQELGSEFRMSHFWGSTGFARDDSSSRDSKTAVRSYMGSAILLGADKPEAEQTLFIAFRGSRGGKIEASALWAVTAGAGKGNPDWVSDLDFGKHFTMCSVVKQKLMSTIRESVGGAKESSTLADNIHNHAGMLKASESCQAGLDNALEDLRINLSTFRGKIVYTGHSLGGGLATLGAYKAGKTHKTQSANIHCITFSAPTVGNEAFVKDFKTYVPNSSRAVIDTDPITIARTSADLHHVHGKMDLTQLALAQMGSTPLPKHLDCKSHIKIDPRAHDTTKVFKLASIIAGVEFTPLITTISKFNLTLHNSIDDNIQSSLQSIDKSRLVIIKKVELMGILNKLQVHNRSIISCCIGATHENADGPFLSNYQDGLKQMISTCIEIEKFLDKNAQSSPALSELFIFVKDLKIALESEVRQLKEKKPILQKSVLVAGSLLTQTRKAGGKVATAPAPIAATLHGYS